MVKLKNISKNNGIISADYEPEASNECGKVALDVQTGEIVEKQLTSYDKYTQTYFHMALRTLEKIKDDEDYPNERLVMWY